MKYSKVFVMMRNIRVRDFCRLGWGLGVFAGSQNIVTWNCVM